MSVRRPLETRSERFNFVLSVGARLFRGLNIDAPKRGLNETREGDTSAGDDVVTSYESDTAIENAQRVLAEDEPSSAQLVSAWQNLSQLSATSENASLRQQARILMNQLESIIASRATAIK